MKVPHHHPIGMHIVAAGVHRAMADHHAKKKGLPFVSQGHSFHHKAEKYHAGQADQHLREAHKQMPSMIGSQANGSLTP